MRAILTYHSIDTSGSVISTDPATFRRQFDWLASGAVRVVGLEQLAALSDLEHALALTFDDGFRNFEEHAAPLLRERALPATVFVVSDHVGKTNRWQDRGDAGVPELELMSWGALARLAESGITIGAHTRTHPRLDRVDPSQLADEIVGSAERIRAETGRAITTFAYPYGRHTPVAANIARSTYTAACTTALRALEGGDDPMLLPRVDMYYLRGRGSLESWGTPRFRYRLGLRSIARSMRERLAPHGGRS